MQTTATNMTIGDLVAKIRNGTLIPRPNFQRKLVWQNTDKLYFLDTVARNLPFPEIYISADSVDLDTGETIYQLVDGQQRVTTLAQYITASSELKLSRDISSYSALSKEQKTKFLQYQVVVRNLGSVTPDEVIEVFKRINSTSYTLNVTEIQNAIYQGEMKKFADRIADNPFFTNHNVFSSREGRRMLDTQYSLSIIATIIKGYFHRNKEIEDILSEYNEEFSDSFPMGEKLQKVFDIIDQINFDKNSRVWGKSDLFTMIVELYKYVEKGNDIDVEKFSDLAKDFYSRSEGAGARDGSDAQAFKYFQVSLQAANDRSSRITRGEILREEVFNKMSN